MAIFNSKLSAITRGYCRGHPTILVQNVQSTWVPHSDGDGRMRHHPFWWSLRGPRNPREAALQALIPRRLESVRLVRLETGIWWSDWFMNRISLWNGSYIYILLHFISVALHMSAFHLTFNFCAFHFAKGHINSCPLDQSPIEQKVEKPEELLRCTGHSLDDIIARLWAQDPEAPALWTSEEGLPKGKWNKGCRRCS